LSYTFVGREKIRKKNKETTTDDKPSIKHHHAWHQEEESEVSLPMTWQNNIFDHGDMLQAPPKQHGCTPTCLCLTSMHYLLLIKKSFNQSEMSKTLLVIPKFNQKIHMKRQNHPWILSSFFLL
jgi:hypothetical protein